jgi:hypothetical protein
VSGWLTLGVWALAAIEILRFLRNATWLDDPKPERYCTFDCPRCRVAASAARPRPETED